MSDLVFIRSAKIDSVLAFRVSETGNLAISPSVSNVTITVPSGAQSGDLAILVDWAVGASTPSLVTPSGWTNFINTNNGSTARGAACWKILTSGDISGTITGMTSGNASDPPNKVMLVFAGPWTAATFSTPGSQITDGNPSSQSATASGETAQLVVVGISAVSGSLGTFTTASPPFDDTVNNHRGSSATHELSVGYKVYTTSPSNHSIDKGDQGNANWLASFYVTVA